MTTAIKASSATIPKYLPLAIALAFALAIVSATPARAEDCYALPQAECNQTANCTFLMACQGCVPAPCDWFSDGASCPSERCGWNATLGVCFEGKPECFQRTTEAQCNDDAPDCTWDAGAQYCLDTMHYCFWLLDEASCDNDAKCGFFDGTCYAVHRMPKCEEIQTISACYIVDGCDWEGLNGACFNESEDAVCSTLGQNKIVCENYAPKCTFNEGYGCLPADMCESPVKEAVSVVYSFDTGLTYWESDLSDRLIEHPTAGEMPPFVILGNNVTAKSTGLDFDGGCISLGQLDSLTFSSGATISIDILHDSLNTSRAEVLLDLSSNAHDLVLTKGPHNALTLFGRQRDRLTVIDTAHDVLTDFTSITLAVGTSHAMVFVDSTLTLHGPWTGGLVKFTGAMRVGCSSTEDNVWYGKLQKLFIFTGLTTTLQNTSSTLPTEPPRVTSADLDLGSGDDSGSGSDGA